jgi:hypothetical protein
LLALSNNSPALPPPISKPAPEPAYFQFDYPPYPETFIVQLVNPDKIFLARAILAGQEPNRIILGSIVKEVAAYNLPWSFYLDPQTVDFVSQAIEICDASIIYVEEHLAEACGAFLPNCIWCPWHSRLVAEVDYPPREAYRSYLPLVVNDFN